MVPKILKTILRISFPLMLVVLLVWPALADGDRSLPAWTKSLTASQGGQIEHMHHELEEQQAQHKKMEAQAQKELNEMTIGEDVKMEDVNKKIDELMTAKREILRLRYAHLIEMRRALSDEQKVGYDEGVLKRSAVR